MLAEGRATTRGSDRLAQLPATPARRTLESIGAGFSVVLFDWRGTLFHDESDEDWIRASAASTGRTLQAGEETRLATSSATQPTIRRSAPRPSDPSAPLSCIKSQRCSSFDWLDSTTSTRSPSGAATVMSRLPIRIPILYEYCGH